MYQASFRARSQATPLSRWDARGHAPYPPEFRRQMVELVRSGRSMEELARGFEPSAGAIRNWVKPAQAYEAYLKTELKPALNG